MRWSGAAEQCVRLRGHRLSGPIAFLMYLTVHLFYLGGVGGRRVTVITTWISAGFGARQNQANSRPRSRVARPLLLAPGSRRRARPSEPQPSTKEVFNGNDLARWQFATTSIYHFLLILVTIGLAFLVAVLQTAWHRTDNPDYKRMTRFFGTLLLINVAIGVVTGLVQEFEFGMNWSVYSRYVGGVFGAPLAMEGLAAFFLESTFLGLWLFGWDRLPKRVHLATIWAVAIGSMLSVMFILMANSWMQHPVGYKLVHGKAELNNIWAVFINPTFLWGYAHVILASLVTGSLVMLAVSAWYLRKPREHVDSFDRTAKVALVVLIPHDRDSVVRRQQARSGRDQIPADEDRRLRGAVEQPQAVLVLCGAVRRLRARASRTPLGTFDPAPALGPRDRHLERTGDRAKPTPGAIPKEIRPRQLRPQRCDPVLVDAGTMAGLGSLVLLLALWGGWLLLEGYPRPVACFPVALNMGSYHAVSDEHRRLAAH